MKNKGFTLLMAIVTTSLLLVISFMVVNIAFKQLIISSVNEESQYAFYNADSGLECAIYWDLHDPSALSQFDSSSVSGAINCQNEDITTNSQFIPIPVPPFPFNTPVKSVIGGTDSIFAVTYTKGCAVVRVHKSLTVPVVTTIDSRGYNNCDINADKRYQRGVIITY
jgi:hypothetical protein